MTDTSGVSGSISRTEVEDKWCSPNHFVPFDLILRYQYNVSVENPLQDTPIVTQALADAGLSLLGDIVKFFAMSILVVIGYYVIYRVYLYLRDHFYTTARDEFERD
ncbi:hypothetical protein CEXT_607911 [Caerostris extrusa]|uniref:Uncharacterized protein n=1 Tax=Caerostris extrusa TaxID=172846 RepID=A0AAV4MVK1_CAEEX|nr:hypothetical protein CEXT_607911 [Caerostris extrusa]